MSVSDVEINLLWNEYKANSKDYSPSPGEYGFATDEALLDKYPEAEIVEEVGGEGQGDHAHVVIKIDDQYFKFDGYYSSYDGTDWDGEWYEVAPVAKVITVYKKPEQIAREDDSWDSDSWD